MTNIYKSESENTTYIVTYCTLNEYVNNNEVFRSYLGRILY